MGLLDFSRLYKEKKEPTRPKLVELRSAKWFILFTVSFAASTVRDVVPTIIAPILTGVQDIFMYGLVRGLHLPK